MRIIIENYEKSLKNKTSNAKKIKQIYLQILITVMKTTIKSIGKYI